MYSLLGDLSLPDLSEIQEINSELVGKYFTEFKEFYYQPVSALEEMFPDDSKVRQNFVDDYGKQYTEIN